MFTAKIASLLRIILLVTCSSQHWLVKYVVSGHPGAINTDIVLLVDFAGVNQSDVESIGELSGHLFHGFTENGANLRIYPLIMRTRMGWYDWNATKVDIQGFLNGEFKNSARFAWKNEARWNHYANGLALSKGLLAKDPKCDIGKAVIMVAYMHESCSAERCFDMYSEPCAKNTSMWVYESIKQVDEMKRLGISAITVGVGHKPNASGLRCFASHPHMFIHYNDYMQLRQKDAAKKILDLLFGIRAHTCHPAVRSSIVTTLPATTKSRVNAHTNVPFVRSSIVTTPPATTRTRATAHTNALLVRSSIITILPTATRTVTTMFSNTKTNAPVSRTVTGIHVTGQSTRNESFLAATKSTSTTFNWYWWILLVIAIIVVALLLAAALLGTVMWRRKRKKRSLGPAVQAENAGSFTRHQQPYASGNRYNSISSGVQNQSSHLLNKPYLEPGLRTATGAEMSKGHDYRIMRSRQASLARPINAGFKASRKPPGTAQCKGAIKVIQHKGKAKQSPGNFMQPTNFGPNTGGKTTQRPKGVGPVGMPEQRRPWHKGNMINDRQGRMKHGPVVTSRVLPMSYIKDTKGLTDPGGPRGARWVRPRSF